MKDELLLKRVPEPELMSTEDALEFARNNDIFKRLEETYVQVADVFNTCDGFEGHGKVLDLACGSGIFAIGAALLFPRLHCLAVDADPTMVGFASSCIRRMRVQDRVEVRRVHIPHDKIEGNFDLVYSRSSLHHFADPLSFWRTVRDCAGMKGSVFVMDLARPPSMEKARDIVEARCPAGSERGKEVYLSSFLSSYRVEEVREQLEKVGMVGCQVADIQPSHLIVWR